MKLRLIEIYLCFEFDETKNIYIHTCIYNIGYEKQKLQIFQAEGCRTMIEHSCLQHLLLLP